MIWGIGILLFLLLDSGDGWFHFPRLVLYRSESTGIVKHHPCWFFTYSWDSQHYSSLRLLARTRRNFPAKDDQYSLSIHLMQCKKTLPCVIMPMASVEPTSENMEHDSIQPVKPRILLAVSGSVAAIKFEILCRSFLEWAEVRAVATKSSLHFFDKASLPGDVILYTDDDEWSSWKKIGDEVLHIELRKWADIMIIAPLSANTLAKIAGGLCDNLLTCIIRAWDFSKPIYVAPAMNTFMWNNPFTKRHLAVIDELGVHLIPPITKRLACGDYGNGAMAEPSVIYTTVRLAYQSLVNGSS